MKKAATFMLATLGHFAGADAQAQDAAISAQKKAAIKSVLPDSYGKLEMRHTVEREVKANGKSADAPKLDVRPILGTTLFDGRVDTSFTWIFRKTPNTTKISKAALYNETKWNVVKGENGDIGPYVVTYQSNDQSFSESYIGLDANLRKDVTISGGTLELSGFIEPMAVLHSGKTAAENKVNVRNKTGGDKFTLDSTTSTSTTQIEQRDPTLWNFSSVETRFKPHAVQDLYVGLGVELTQKWDPRYAARNVDGDTRVEHDGYTANAVTTNVFRVGYKVSEAVVLAGALRQNIGGYYGQSIDENTPDPTGYWATTRWESRLTLQANLF